MSLTFTTKSVLKQTQPIYYEQPHYQNYGGHY